MPRSLVAQRVQRGRWPETIAVAEVGTQRWHTFREYVAVIAPAAPIAPQTQPPAAASAPATQPPAYASSVRDDDDHPALAGAKFLAANKTPADGLGGRGGEGDATGWSELPAGGAIHAGFWRRVAARVLDSILFGLIGTAVYIVALILVFLSPIIGAMVALLGFVGLWLWYYPWQEGAGPQATFGKRAFAIKVAGRDGHAIGLGRALWRRLSQLVIPLAVGVFGAVSFMSSVGPVVEKLKASKNPDPFAVFSVFNSPFFATLIKVQVAAYLVIALTYLLAGWTRRKQSLYDTLSGAFVVFNEVRPGQRLPRQRPPMPWYGWLINVLVGLWLFSTLATIPLFLAIMREMPAQLKVAEAVAAGAAIQGEIDKQGCQTGPRPLPNPALGKAEVTSGVLGVCTITLTLANTADAPAALRGGMIEWTRGGNGRWSCSTDLPEQYALLCSH
jgi:uncharacterized RDD family membrane protein YckC